VKTEQIASYKLANIDTITSQQMIDIDLHIRNKYGILRCVFP
jgi:hypothetical protein